MLFYAEDCSDENRPETSNQAVRPPKPLAVHHFISAIGPRLRKHLL